MKWRNIYLLCLFITFGQLTFAQLDSGNQLKRKNADIEKVNIYPNPIQTVATIELTLTEGSDVLIEFFDLTGKKVNQQSMKDLNPGTHQVAFNSSEMKNGIYLCKVSAKDFVEAKRIIIKH